MTSSWVPLDGKLNGTESLDVRYCVVSEYEDNPADAREKLAPVLGTSHVLGKGCDWSSAGNRGSLAGSRNVLYSNH